jgi:MFS family permease
MGVLALLFWVFARDNPEECGLQMDGDHVAKVRKENLDSLIHKDYTLREARATFSFWVFTLMFGLNGLVVTAYAFHIIEIGAELGEISGLFMTVIMLASAVGPFLFSLAAAWLGSYRSGFGFAAVVAGIVAVAALRADNPQRQKITLGDS